MDLVELTVEQSLYVLKFFAENSSENLVVPIYLMFSCDRIDSLVELSKKYKTPVRNVSIYFSLQPVYEIYSVDAAIEAVKMYDARIVFNRWRHSFCVFSFFYWKYNYSSYI